MNKVEYNKEKKECIGYIYQLIRENYFSTLRDRDIIIRKVKKKTFLPIYIIKGLIKEVEKDREFLEEYET